jgi:hypothetical protein
MECASCVGMQDKRTAHHSPDYACGKSGVTEECFLAAVVTWSGAKRRVSRWGRNTQILRSAETSLRGVPAPLRMTIFGGFSLRLMPDGFQSLNKLSNAARASFGRWLGLLDVSFSIITRIE